MAEREEHDPDLTHEMMIAALNRILGECGYPPVSAEGPAAGTADRMIADARTRADGIIAAARQTAVQYTDAALDQAARTMLSARRTVAGPPVPREPGAQPATDHPAGPVGAAWLAAVTAAGVYLPLAEPVAARTLDLYASSLRDAATGDPPDVEAAYRIGLDVVALGIGRPDALPATLGIVLDHLGDGDVLAPAARRVAGAFAAGFAAALQARTLAQQESLHRATQRAAREFQIALQDSEARYRRLAYYDPVTGLATKARLVQRLRQAANGADPQRHTGLCLIEIGGYPAVCEQFGAEAGDHVLGEVARRLRVAAEHPDYLPARHGSHTFTMLVHDSGGLVHLADLAEQLTRTLAEPASLPDTGLTAPLQAHIGAVDVAGDDLEPARVLVDAEIALRQARAGTSGWAVYDSRPAAGPRGGTSVSGLVTGPPTYQPIVHLGSGRVAGLHTRMVWRHPHLGTLDLTRIGQLTGDRETTTRLAGTLLQQAGRQAMQWDGGPGGPFVGVDIPLSQIGYPDSAELVREALAASGLPPARLHLHLSGLDAVPAGKHSLTVLAAVAELGVRIELDDFGTGFTSLAYLRDLPVHGLRTPAGLLQSTAAGSDADRALLAGLARTAHALGLTLTVHGVDDELRAQALAGSGCDGGQGVCFGAPATPHQVPALLRRPGKLLAAS
ncbi:GGDEF domain-containing protein [Actinoplanes sp. N902-109]|uniref:bifunctional diguanylate cyclase/phosphodiesterase n=1 Tax=Actinoplanes sp. (strain N902-109) TaxID=649831 RepID=UPI0003294DC2|nr:GGDEF domain-containing protein [Actinoplanes sp. N902-109]AGL17849.1 diguanylate cyclase/phosphodiesterase [Actinoplanes sp. N902-109]